MNDATATSPATAAHAEAVILAYWKSWQTKDWDTMRGALADELDFGGHVMPREGFVQMCQQGKAWDDVKLLDSIFTAEGGALIYEGTNTADGKRVRVAEIVRLSNGKVGGALACFGTGTPPQ
ncbi:MAG: hypothetical protein AAF721_24085 [Myxococcota bacterium]